MTIYKFISGNWTPYSNTIDGISTNTNMGFSVSMSEDGTKLAVSCSDHSISGSAYGQVRVYSYLSGNWTQIGNSINEQSASDTINYVFFKCRRK
ncbi:MAG: hypothetical protein ABI426_04120 [Flavobacterium sp.]